MEVVIPLLLILWKVFGGVLIKEASAWLIKRLRKKFWPKKKHKNQLFPCQEPTKPISVWNSFFVAVILVGLFCILLILLRPFFKPRDPEIVTPVPVVVPTQTATVQAEKEQPVVIDEAKAAQEVMLKASEDQARQQAEWAKIAADDKEREEQKEELAGVLERQKAEETIAEWQQVERARAAAEKKDQEEQRSQLAKQVEELSKAVAELEKRQAEVAPVQTKKPTSPLLASRITTYPKLVPCSITKYPDGGWEAFEETKYLGWWKDLSMAKNELKARGYDVR